MKHVDPDADSGIEIWRLDTDDRPTDNIYGEQSYASLDGAHLTLRHYATDDREGGLSILDLRSGASRPILEAAPRFPAFHGWGEHLYGQQMMDGRLMLRRWHWATGEGEALSELPAHEGRFSYGTVSADGRHYAVCVHNDPPAPCRVLHVDLETGDYHELTCSSERYYKHEQFSRDGRDRVMLQGNSADVSQVSLTAVNLEGEIIPFAADMPHTLRPTGHEAWVGEDSTIFFSTRWDEEKGNLFTATLGQDHPMALGPAIRGGHVSVSGCGTYWLVDDGSCPDVPLRIGHFAFGQSARVVSTGTVHDEKQWSHAHPYLTADNAWAIFTSNRSGQSHAYGARLPEQFLASLA